MLKCIVIGIAISSLLLSACSSSTPTDPNDPGGNNTTTFSNTFSGTINGTTWTVGDLYALKVEGGGTTYGFSFVANDPVSGRSTSFGTPLTFAVGTFTVGGGSFNNASFDDGTEVFDKTVTGTITVTAVNDKGIKGSFSFAGKSEDDVSGTATGTFEATWDN